MSGRAWFPEAECFRIYRDLRNGVPDVAKEIGCGFNCYPVAPGLVRRLQASLAHLAASGRLEQYTCADDDRERELCALLIARRFGLSGITGNDVIFTHGGSEAISVVMAGLSLLNLGVALPNPTYYCYEQSALRYNVPVVCRYWSGDAFVGSPPPYGAIISIQPNAVTGQPSELPGGGAAAALHVTDIVFQLALPGRAGELDSLFAAELSSLDLRAAALLLTPSKDLSLPSLRTGIIVTRNDTLLHFAKQDRYERTFSTSPLCSHIALYYLTLSLLYSSNRKSGLDGMKAEHSRLADAYHFHGCPLLPTIEECEGVVNHLVAMSIHCARSMDILRQFRDVLDPASLQEPVAGFSCFPRLSLPFGSHSAFNTWVNLCGARHHLKLNPAVLYGGCAESWDRLSPDGPRIRVNLSVAHEELRATLATLRSAVQETLMRA